MIEIKDISKKELTEKVLDNIGEIKLPPVITINRDMSVVDIFNVLVNSGIMDSKELYELGSYLRTFADFHAPVEPAPADRPVPYRGF